MTIEYRNEEITVTQLVTIIRDLAESCANGCGSLYRNLTISNDDVSVDVKLRVSDHFPNPARVYDNNTLSFALPDAVVHVGTHRRGFMFLDNDYQYDDCYQTIEYIVEDYLDSCLIFA
jgi:hypothetical protein